MYMYLYVCVCVCVCLCVCVCAYMCMHMCVCVQQLLDLHGNGLRGVAVESVCNIYVYIEMYIDVCVYR